MSVTIQSNYPDGYEKDKVGKQVVFFKYTADQLNREIPIDFIILIDKSGSMKGEKMIMLKATIEYMIRHLSKVPKHNISLISFNNEAEVNTGNDMVELIPENEKYLLDILKTIEPSGSTNFGGALMEASKIINNRRTKNIPVILFLTDGHTNIDPMGWELIKYIKQLNFPKEIVLHTFAIGSDHDPVLLRKINNGSYFYIETIDMIADTLLQAVNTSIRIISKNITLTIIGNKGCRIINSKLTNFPYEEVEYAKKYIYDFGNISDNESKSLNVTISINKGEAGTQQALTYILKYTDSVSNDEITNSYDYNIERVSNIEIIPKPNFQLELEMYKYLIGNIMNNYIENTQLSYDKTIVDATLREINEVNILLSKLSEEYLLHDDFKLLLYYMSKFKYIITEVRVCNECFIYINVWTDMLLKQKYNCADKLKNIDTIINENNTKSRIVETLPSRRRIDISDVTAYNMSSKYVQTADTRKEINRYVENYLF